MRRPGWCGHKTSAGVRLIHSQIHKRPAGPGNVGRNCRIAATRFAAQDTCCREYLCSMANGSDRFVRIREVAHNFENTCIEADVLGRAPARNNQGIVVLGLNVVEGSIQPEVMTPFLAVGLVSFEIVDRGSHYITGSFIRTNSVYRMPNRKKSLEGDHDFVIFDVVAYQHQELFRSHRDTQTMLAHPSLSLN